MHGDLLSLDESTSIIHNLSQQFGEIGGVLVLDKSQFCIGGESTVCMSTAAFSDTSTAKGSLKESDASIVAELTDNVCTTPHNVYKIHLSDNRGYVLQHPSADPFSHRLSFLYLLNNQRITVAILQPQ